MHPTASITYMRHGATVTRARAADDPELVRPIPLLLRKLLWFRPVDLDRHSRCQW